MSAFFPLEPKKNDIKRMANNEKHHQNKTSKNKGFSFMSGG